MAAFGELLYGQFYLSFYGFASRVLCADTVTEVAVEDGVVVLLDEDQMNCSATAKADFFGCTVGQL
jgi:hypothetical protein